MGERMNARITAAAEVVTITPKMAETWLKTMVANRPLSESKTIEYGLAMEASKWVLNGETIKFDGERRLFDGQHRLQACVLAGKPFDSHVIWGIEDPNAFATVDTGKVRSTADVFGIAGWTNNKTAAGASTLILAYTHKRLHWAGIQGRYSTGGKSELAGKLKRGAMMAPYSREELMTFASSIEQELAQAVRFANGSKASRVMPSATVAALYYLFRQKSASDAEVFFTSLGEGTSLKASDPVYVLREKLMKAKKSDAKLTRWAIAGFAIKAWNRRRDREPTQVLRYAEGEAFPRVK